MKELILACVRTKNPITNNEKKYEQDDDPKAASNQAQEKAPNIDAKTKTYS